MNSGITMPVLVGAVFGLGVYTLVRALMPGRRGAVARVAQIDALRARGSAHAGRYEADRGQAGGAGQESRLEAARVRIGQRVADLYLQQGWEQRSLRADLAVLERSWESFLATKVLLGAAGLVFGPFVFVIVWTLGFGSSPIIPVWMALLFGAVFFMLPDLEVRRDAADKRRDLRRVIGAYLDLVAMNLAGGRGLPESLMAAADVSDGWALRRIKNALADARITGTSQWQALGNLGEELGVDELKDLSSSLALVADDGAKVRESLGSRAETMRHRELAEIEGSAGEKSQSMLVAQLLLCAGFLVFLIFPAAMRVFEV
ncbi:type II secretion system F family protein [Streptomyces buecherae]|uniref:Type II secretion system F family protein n=1 Tax=Streptomyces buecherae TaxID=2763006 RepID=A0A7G8KFU1_9ACTN|nr:type II secretion system F family protein [Streptomyces buecherae]MBC3985369.1 type II secretion system F family protein [Streptomyces buecherae]MBC3992178.1 type II secretion system F family protein [Streptomyces buecherae]QKW50430.1 type II secretion system F family protein [Streptomyces buecherae]QNJ41924.1 type II secretion system F family protein [Streptomyces buecherae]